MTETFEVMRINWGDGTIDDNTDADASDPITIVNRVSGDVDVTTTAQFDHAPHAYADNGTYTVTVTIKDDDGNFVDRQFTIQVDNVAPVAHAHRRGVCHRRRHARSRSRAWVRSAIQASTTRSIPTPSRVAASRSFSYSIDWGDGTRRNRPTAGRDVVNGAQGVLTTGTLANSHFYADNDADNKYTITVTLTDDDGDSVVKSFEITVHNVNPTLLPIAATDIDANTGSTTLTLQFSDPGADSFQILVDWGDKLGVPNPNDRFVVETLYAGPTPQSFVIVHTYSGPPDPDHPTADIGITVKIRDDDFQTLGVVAPGESNPESVAISNPGIQTNNVAIDTTPDVPRLDLTQRPMTEVFVPDQGGLAQLLQVPDVRGGGGEVAATAERYLELRIVYPDGTESQGFRIKDEALADLRAFFKTLPDGRYRIYLVRTENHSERLVIEVDVRRGRVIDVSDDSEGTRDRPPTGEEQSTDAVPLEQNPQLEAAPGAARQGDTETRRQGDTGTNQGTASTSESPCLPLSLSPCLPLL